MNLFTLKNTAAAMVMALGLTVGFAPDVMAQHFHGNLTHSSPISQHIRPGCHYRIYRVFMRAGCHYHISLESRDFDTYLYVLCNHGHVQAQNDDGGNGLNSALTFYPNYTGWHEIMVTSFGRDRTGHFHLDIDRH